MDLFLDNQFCSIGLYLYATTTLDFIKKLLWCKRHPQENEKIIHTMGENFSKPGKYKSQIRDLYLEYIKNSQPNNKENPIFLNGQKSWTDISLQ